MVSSGVTNDKNAKPILVDSSGRPYVILDDGAGNTMPAMDVRTRAGFHKITDGTSEAKLDTDDDNIDYEQRTILVINLNYVYEPVFGRWVRMTQP